MSVVHIRRTQAFADWLQALPDVRARARIQARIDRMQLGNPGDIRPVGGGIAEMRIDHGPGYRVYFRQQGKVVVLLLCGGDKSTQVEDIRRARALAERLE